jgi:catechol 2,3-dioxygenase-like lactoylglutathione lyase family enzyme
MTQALREITIPLLPCNSIDQTIEFYQALGFVVTYQQKRPNAYAVVTLRYIELHFFVIKALKPESNYSSCYVLVNDIDGLYASFAAGLRNLYQKLPIRGIPRINPLKDMPVYGVRQFIVVDPAGNHIRIGQPIAKADSLVYTENNRDTPAAGTPLEKAYEMGNRLADGKGDFVAAAKVLDNAIAVADKLDAYALLRVLILRADIATRQEAYSLTASLLETIRELAAGFDPEKIREELRLIVELQTLLGEK